MTLDAPFPCFGGKSRIAPLIWQRFGRVANVVEPFFGSGACLLARPGGAQGTETINDADGFVANFWRALQEAPDEVAEHADHPVNECDLHARHLWLVSRRGELTERLMGDPDWYDAKAAGWWVWGISCWIGGGWCSGKGPWVASEDGRFVRREDCDAGQGVNRKRPHLGNACMGVCKGRDLRDWFGRLAARLRRVRVCCGDWSRVCGPSVTYRIANRDTLTAVFLDPPYADTADRCSDLYSTDSLSVAHAVREWAIAEGDNPLMRIALCGYEGEHAMPESWECVAWKASGGYGGGMGTQADENSARERVWFSPHCLSADQGRLL